MNMAILNLKKMEQEHAPAMLQPRLRIDKLMILISFLCHQDPVTSRFLEYLQSKLVFRVYAAIPVAASCSDAGIQLVFAC